MRYYSEFPRAIPRLRANSYVFLTRPPLGVLLHLARLACVRHAASVQSEPGSNSPIEKQYKSLKLDPPLSPAKGLRDVKSYLRLLNDFGLR
jgi:hypothetical protein